MDAQSRQENETGPNGGAGATVVFSPAVERPPAVTAEDIRKAVRPGAPSPVRRIIFWLCLILLLAGAAYFFRTKVLAALHRVPVYETAEARRADLRIAVRATGTLEALTTVEVGAEVTGRLLSVSVNPNDAVKKGQVLAEIDPEQLRAAVEQSTAQVAASEAAIQQARATANESTRSLDRIRTLHSQGHLSQSELDGAIAAKERADANLESAIASATLARASLKMAASHLGKTTIYSPIDGIVLARFVEPGQTVTAGFQTPILFKLAEDLTRMRLNVAIDEADIGRVAEGQEATFTVEAYPDRAFPSSVVSILNEPTTSQNVVTYQAALAADNTERLLRPGMTCTATIVAETKRDILVVPNAALRFTPPALRPKPGQKQVGVEGEIRQQVWTMNGETPVAIPIRTGVTDGEATEVLEGDILPGTPLLIDVKEPLQ